MTNADSPTLVGEFKNELEAAQWVLLTIGYEYYDGPRPDFKDSHIVWLTLAHALRCGAKENPFDAPNITSKGVPKSLVFSEATKPWATPFNFIILGVGGHLHDGGPFIDVSRPLQKKSSTLILFRSTRTTNASARPKPTTVQVCQAGRFMAPANTSSR